MATLPLAESLHRHEIYIGGDEGTGAYEGKAWPKFSSNHSRKFSITGEGNWKHRLPYAMTRCA